MKDKLGSFLFSLLIASELLFYGVALSGCVAFLIAEFVK